MDHLRDANQEQVKQVMQHCSDVRSIHRCTTNGYTKSRSMRKIAEIPIDLYFSTEVGKYFNREADVHERRKDVYAWLDKNPQFKTVDKL